MAADDVRIMQDSTGAWFWASFGEGGTTTASARFKTRDEALANAVENGANRATVWMDGVTNGAGYVDPMPARVSGDESITGVG